VINRLNRAVLVCVGLAVLPAIGFGVGWAAHTGNPANGIRSAAAILLAGFVVGLAVSLPGLTWEGLFLGVGILLAAMMTWTHLDQPRYVWAFEGVIGLVALVASYPWWRSWRELPRLGSFWLVLPAWVFGLVSAVVAGSLKVTAQRGVYLVYAAAVLLLLFRSARHRGKDISMGFAAGILIAHAALIVAGRDYFFLFNGAPHYTSQSAWGFAQGDRFWGGPWLVYHPNFIGMTAIIAAVRIGADQSLKLWQRYSSLAVAALVLVAVKSRTSLLVAVVAAVVYLAVYAWQHGLPRWRVWAWLGRADWRRVVVRGLVPLAACLLVLAASGGTGLLTKSRYGAQQSDGYADSVLSGRAHTWGVVVDDFRDAPIVEKIFGTADNSRGYMLAIKDKTNPHYAEQPKLTADNGPLGALHRGGLLSLAAFVVGAVLVLWRSLRRGLPLWVPVVTVAMLATAATEDEITGTTPAWIIVALAELFVLYLAGRGAAGKAGTPGTEAQHARDGVAAPDAGLVAP
jgi:hypothetical protein